MHNHLLDRKRPVVKITLHFFAVQVAQELSLILLLHLNSLAFREAIYHLLFHRFSNGLLQEDFLAVDFFIAIMVLFIVVFSI